MRVPVAFVDANVLYSKTLRDWLMLLRIETGGGMFALCTSEDSLTEALYHLRKSEPAAPGEFTGEIQKRIREYFDDVIDAFPAIEFPGDDEHDQHIHAAATFVNSAYLIADDTGFQKIDTDLLPYEVHTADTFFMLVAANMPSAVDSVIIRQLKYYAGRENAKRLDVKLQEAGCPRFAECVRLHLEHLAAGESTHGIADELILAAPAP